MKTLTKYTLPALMLLLVLAACKTTKNTVVHRGYHNLTARFNGYYYATESIKEAEDKIRTDYKFDYDRLLPVFLVPTEESAKSTFPDFDKAIKKSSNAIQRHTIKDKKGNEIASAGHWIDNNWNVIGISHFYKREFFSAIEAFEYVIRTYKSPDRYKAMVWLARSYNEIGSVSQAEPIIGLLKDDKKISGYAKQELPALQADYYLKRGMYKEAEKALLEAIKAKPPKKTRARYAYILGQLYEEKNDNKKAIEYFQKTISAKPDYDLVFHAKMRQARLVDLKYGNAAKLKRDLIRMTRDEKNQEYLDIIYYTLGEISEREKNEPMAITNYKLSVAKSTQNPKQKALSYLKLGEIGFEQANYEVSGAYYDSTMITLPKEYKDYATIEARKKTLETLVGYIRTIQREDSLQRVAKMPEAQRDKFITRMIQQIEAEEERKREEQEALQAQNLNPDYNNNLPNNGMADLGIGAKGDWYFYNPTLVAFGINDFIKKWGNRKLEDNWRRSQKSMTFDDPATAENDSINTVAGTDSVAMKKKAKSKDKKNVEYYLKDLPMNDSLMKLSNIKIIDAYYNLGSTYKDDLKNNKKAIATFEELNKRYEQHKFRPSSYYQLYRIFQSVKNNQQADNYKNKLLNEFPNSEYAQLIKNPNYEAEKKLQKGEVEVFYAETFDKYSGGNYEKAYALSKESESKFGKTDYSPKFAFIKAMAIGKMKGIDSLEMALRTMQALYPKDPVSTEAQTMLEILYEIKHPSESTGPVNRTDTFTLNTKAKHFVIAVFPDDPDMANAFKSSLSDFNTSFYGISNLGIESSLFGSTEQIVYVKTFDNAEAAMKYINNLKKDKMVFSGNVKPELFTIMAISEDNIQRLARKKKVSYYKPFYDDHYR